MAKVKSSMLDAASERIIRKKEAEIEKLRGEIKALRNNRAQAKAERAQKARQKNGRIQDWVANYLCRGDSVWIRRINGDIECEVYRVYRDTNGEVRLELRESRNDRNYRDVVAHSIVKAFSLRYRKFYFQGDMKTA